MTPDRPNDPQKGQVWDAACLETDYDNVVLRFKSASAIIHNDGEANGSILSSALFSAEGTPIGYNKLVGTIPGGSKYSGYITYTLVAENTETALSIRSSLDGGNWADVVYAKPGEIIIYKVEFENIGNTNLTNVIFKESHDEGLSLVSGSTTVFDSVHVDGIVIDDILDISGYNTGDVYAGALRQIVFCAKVVEDETLIGKVLENTISVRYNSEDQQSDTVQIYVS